MASHNDAQGPIERSSGDVPQRPLGTLVVDDSCAVACRSPPPPLPPPPPPQLSPHKKKRQRISPSLKHTDERKSVPLPAYGGRAAMGSSRSTSDSSIRDDNLKLQALLKSFGLRAARIQQLSDLCLSAPIVPSKSSTDTRPDGSSSEGAGGDAPGEPLNVELTGEIWMLLFDLYPFLLGCCNCYFAGSREKMEESKRRYDKLVSDAMQLLEAAHKAGAGASRGSQRKLVVSESTEPQCYSVPSGPCLLHSPTIVEQRPLVSSRLHVFMQLALRIFVSVLRLAVHVPGVPLVCTLMLLTSLPALADFTSPPPNVDGEKSEGRGKQPAPVGSNGAGGKGAGGKEDRVLAALRLAMTALFLQDAASFFSLMDQLVNVDGKIGHFALRAVPQVRSRPTSAELSVVVREGDLTGPPSSFPVPATPAGNRALQRRSLEFRSPTLVVAWSDTAGVASLGVFTMSAVILAETTLEIVRVAYGFLGAVERLMHAQVPLKPTAFGIRQLARVCCNLLALDVGTELVDALQQQALSSHFAKAADEPGEPPSTSPPSPLLLEAARAYYASFTRRNSCAGACLEALIRRYHLVREVDGTMVCYTVVKMLADAVALDSQLREANTSCGRHGATFCRPLTLESPTWAWVRVVLDWLVVEPRGGRIRGPRPPVAFTSSSKKRTRDCPFPSTRGPHEVDEHSSAGSPLRHGLTESNPALATLQQEAAVEEAENAAPFHSAFVRLCSETTILEDILGILFPLLRHPWRHPGERHSFGDQAAPNASSTIEVEEEEITGRIPSAVVARLIDLVQLFMDFSDVHFVRQWFSRLLSASTHSARGGAGWTGTGVGGSHHPSFIDAHSQSYTVGLGLVDRLLQNRCRPSDIVMASQAPHAAATDRSASSHVIRLFQLFPAEELLSLVSQRLADRREELLARGLYGVAVGNCTAVFPSWPAEMQHVEELAWTIRSFTATSTGRLPVPLLGEAADGEWRSETHTNVFHGAYPHGSPTRTLRFLLDSFCTVLSHTRVSEVAAIAGSILDALPLRQPALTEESETAVAAEAVGRVPVSLFFSYAQDGLPTTEPSPTSGHPILPVDYDGSLLALLLMNSSASWDDDDDTLLPRLRGIFSLSFTSPVAAQQPAARVTEGLLWLWIGALRGFNILMAHKAEAIPPLGSLVLFRAVGPRREGRGRVRTTSSVSAVVDEAGGLAAMDASHTQELSLERMGLLLRTMSAVLNQVLPLIHTVFVSHLLRQPEPQPQPQSEARDDVRHATDSGNATRSAGSAGTLVSLFFAEITQLQMTLLTVSRAYSAALHTLAALAEVLKCEGPTECERIGCCTGNAARTRCGSSPPPRGGSGGTASDNSRNADDNGAALEVDEARRTRKKAGDGKAPGNRSGRKVPPKAVNGGNRQKRTASVVCVNDDDDDEVVEVAEKGAAADAGKAPRPPANGADNHADGDDEGAEEVIIADAGCDAAGLSAGVPTRGLDAKHCGEVLGHLSPQRRRAEELLIEARDAQQRVATAMRQLYFSITSGGYGSGSEATSAREGAVRSDILSTADICVASICLGVAASPRHSGNDALVFQTAATHPRSTIRQFFAPLAVASVLEERFQTPPPISSPQVPAPPTKMSPSSSSLNSYAGQGIEAFLEAHWVRPQRLDDRCGSGQGENAERTKGVTTDPLVRQLSTLKAALCSEAGLVRYLPFSVFKFSGAELRRESDTNETDVVEVEAAPIYGVAELSQEGLNASISKSVHLSTRLRTQVGSATHVASCFAFIVACVGFLETMDGSLDVQSLSLECIRAALEQMDWSMEDLCRRLPLLLSSPAFALLCELMDTNPSGVTSRCVDHLLPACVFDREINRLKQIEEILGMEYLRDNGFCSVVAFALLQSSASVVEEKVAKLQTIEVFMGKSMSSILSLLHRFLAYILVCIVSLTGVAACDQESNSTSRDCGDGSGGLPSLAQATANSYEGLAAAVQSLLLLSECDAHDANLKEVLSSTLSPEDAGRILKKHVFEVIDSISLAMGIEHDRQQLGAVHRHVSAASKRQWLIGISALVRFLGPRATLIAPKLPAMLNECGMHPALTSSVCLVWRDLVSCCTSEYLAEHAPSIVVDLLSLERQRAVVDSQALVLLHNAMKIVYTRTAHGTFWQSYFMVMGRTSALIKNLGRDVAAMATATQRSPSKAKPQTANQKSKQRRRNSTGPQEVRAEPGRRRPGPRDVSEGPLAHEAALSSSNKASTVVAGFLTVMQASSPKCRDVFVHALFQYLRSSDGSARLEMTAAACAYPALVPTLLECVRELPSDESRHYALKCVGMIGAIAPSTRLSVPCEGVGGTAVLLPQMTGGTSAKQEPSGNEEGMSLGDFSSDDAIRREAQLMKHVTDWRALASTLLGVYCPRALANTADPLMHDRVAYAMQELLRVCTNKERLELGGLALRDLEKVHVEELQRYSWWESLDPKLQQTMEAFTMTSYRTVVIQPMERRTPVYRSGMSFHTWVGSWFRNLVSRCGGIFGLIVNSLRNVAKRDLGLMSFLLPLLVVHLLERAEEEDIRDMAAEFDVLFARSTTMEEAMSRSGGMSDEAVHYLNTQQCVRTPSQQPHLRGRAASGGAHLSKGGVEEHVQQLMHLLEDVERLRCAFLRAARRVVRDPLPSGHGEASLLQSCHKFDAFLRMISWERRAVAAISINSNICALRCIEGQRELPTPSSLLQAIPFMEDVYSRLEDRDSARSINRAAPARQSSKAALAYESTGEWTLALQACELYLQYQPDSVPHQLSSLRCMMHLGQLHLMSRYAQSLLQPHVHGALLSNRSVPPSAFGFHRPQGLTATHGICAAGASQGPQRSLIDAGGATSGWLLNAYRADAMVQHYANEAAWRLGEWQMVQPCEVRGVSLAQPMVALMAVLEGTGTVDAVRAEASKERAKLLPLLSASCREGYRQGYRYVSILHALADIETLAEALWTEGELWTRHHGHGTQNPALTLHSHDGAAGNAVLRESHGARRAVGVQGGASGAAAEARERLSCTAAAAMSQPARQVLSKLVPVLAARLQTMEPTLEAQEPVLSAHRAIYRALGMKKVVSGYWLRHAQLLRNKGQLDAAINAAKQSTLDGELPHPSYYVNVAKLLYELKEPTRALEFTNDAIRREDLSEAVRSKLLVNSTSWRHEVGSQTSKEVIAAYESAIQKAPSEAAHYQLAMFYDKLFQSTTASLLEASNASSAVAIGSNASNVRLSEEARLRETINAVDQYVNKSLEHFGCALQRGITTVSVSLPRMLTLWLSCTASFAVGGRMPASCEGKATSVAARLNATMERLLLLEGGISPAILMMSLSQLLSRLGHANTDVVSIITRTVVYLMTFFPQQCLWSVLPLAFSKQTARAQVARQQILHVFVKKGQQEGKVVDHGYAIFTALIELCNAPASAFQSGNARLSKMAYIQKVDKLLPTARFVLPLMLNLSPNIFVIYPHHGGNRRSSVVVPGHGGEWDPTDGDGEADWDDELIARSAEAQRAAGRGACSSGDDVPLAYVFPTSPTFYSFEDKVDVMSSLQKPKKITIVSNEGQRVPFLCKSRDEPRKDMRMMEIASLMNTFFLADPEARRRRFSLRRYSVSALSDDCAIIEWVSNTTPLRRVVEECYVMDGTGVKTTQVKAWKAKVDDGAMTKMEMFTRYILPAAPPVLHQWFHVTFARNQDWYEARALYTQTCALWSIAGHIIGLGDRHGENLMLDMKTGGLMHVDFACMFDKGETLEVPERVRFRLTPNVVDAMGVLGSDGPFRSCCELTLRCEMKNKDAVMSVVETLLHDPLVEWTSRPSSRNYQDPERLIKNVSRRLNGFLDLYSQPRERDMLALSVEGQVSKLISHSSALENLSEMYIWWMAWI